ncbi:hypothetical protein EON81_27125, partial [bacterium]
MRSSLSLFALGAVLALSGCGGGSGGSAEVGTIPDGPTNQFGPIETRGTVNGTPVVHDLAYVSTVALAGVLTDATYRLQGKPDNETAISVLAGNYIDLYLPSGEKLDSLQPGGVGATVYGEIRWAPDGQKFYVSRGGSIYTVSVNNPDTLTLVVSGPISGRFDLSPDGTKLAYSKTVSSNEDVYYCPSGGGLEVRLTTSVPGQSMQMWASNSSLIYYDVDSGINKSINLTGTFLTNYFPTLTSPMGRSADGRYL